MVPRLLSLARTPASRGVLQLVAAPLRRPVCGSQTRCQSDSTTINDIIDGRIAQKSMWQQDVNRYPMLGNIPKEEYDRAIHGIEHSARVHQSAMKFGDSIALFMQREMDAYNAARIRLTKMMGIDPKYASTRIANNAVSYLMPSQLWEKTARPHLWNPEDTFGTKHPEQSIDAYPAPPGYYTRNPAFHDLLFSIYEKATIMQQKVGKTEFHELMEEFNQRSEDLVWLSKNEMERKLREGLSPNQYQFICERLELLANHKMAHAAASFLKEWAVKSTARKTFVSDSRTQTGVGKNAQVSVTLRAGTGRVFIRKRNAVRHGRTQSECLSAYFHRADHRRMVMHPFVLTNTLGLFDADAEVHHDDQKSPTAFARGLRQAISKALIIMNPKLEEILVNANLTVADPRVRERKKVGRYGARRGTQWSKR